MATCATQAIRDGKVTEALQLYNKYGAPPFPQNFNIYKRIGKKHVLENTDFFVMFISCMYLELKIS